MAESKMAHFMNGFVAAVQLLQRVAENGYLVEYVCLAASVIDGSLRLGLILQHQLKTQSAEVLDNLLLQTDGDQIVSERKLYRRALREGVIDSTLSQDLEDLYTKRNRVVHRYIISDLTTREVLKIATEFERILPVVNAAVGALEALQVERSVGMTRSGELPGLGRALAEMSAEKHGDPHLATLLKSNGT